MILWSIHTFWYKGSAENKEKIHVRERRYISQTKQPQTQSIIKKNRYDVKRLIVARYDIVLKINIYSIYKRPYQNRYQIGIC